MYTNNQPNEGFPAAAQPHAHIHNAMSGQKHEKDTAALLQQHQPNSTQPAPTNNGSFEGDLKVNVLEQDMACKVDESLLSRRGSEIPGNSAAEEAANTRRVIASSIIGNTLEWYDFLVYVYLGNAISKLFFPSTNTYARLLAFYGIFAAGFLTRPLGAAIFGHIGDKYGRKTALTWSIYLMSIPTALVGCLPTYEQAGIAAPVLLVIIRVMQGFAVGGEFTSTMVFLVEHAPPDRRGLQGSWSFFSVMIGVITGSLVAMTVNLALTDEHLYSWGWRVPFLVSVVGAAVGVYIRRQLKEPELSDDDHHHGHGHAKGGKIMSAITAISAVVMIDFLTAIGFYLIVIFLPLYYQEFVGLNRKMALLIHTMNMLLYLPTVPLGGWLSDKYGRTPVMAIPAAVFLALSYPLWMAFKTGNTFMVWMSQAIMSVTLAMFSGVIPCVFVSLFPPQLRCTGVSLGHNLSMAAFGGTAPLMATGLLQHTGDIASPAALLVIAGALSLVGVAMTWKLFKVR